MTFFTSSWMKWDDLLALIAVSYIISAASFSQEYDSFSAINSAHLFSKLYFEHLAASSTTSSQSLSLESY
jgi:hypothetical protein